MSNLRDIVRRHVEDQVSSELQAGATFNETQLKIILDKQRSKGTIDREVDHILGAFLEEIEKNSPQKRRRRILNFSFSAASLVLTTLIGYAVNITNWPMVVGMIIATLIINGLFLFFADQ